jgi:hypothetical protein
MVRLKRKPRGRLVEGAKGAVSWNDGTEGDAFYSRRAAYIRAVEDGREVWYRDRDLTDAEVAAIIRTRPVECERCDGVGWVEGGVALHTSCSACGGSGVVDAK